VASVVLMYLYITLLLDVVRSITKTCIREEFSWMACRNATMQAMSGMAHFEIRRRRKKCR
jgi:hypothetical protein